MGAPVLSNLFTYLRVAPNTDFQINKYRQNRTTAGLLLDIALISIISGAGAIVSLVVWESAVPNGSETVNLIIFMWAVLLTIVAGFVGFRYRNGKYFDGNALFNSPLYRLRFD
jgi:hypothetical protein